MVSAPGRPAAAAPPASFSVCVVALAAAALLPPAGALLLTREEYCSLPLPISSRGLVAEYDVNCNFNISALTWASRAGTPAAPIEIPPGIKTGGIERYFCYTSVNGSLGKCALALSVPQKTNFHLTIPVDISPSVMPDVSVEIFAQVRATGNRGSKYFIGTKEVTYPQMLFSTGPDDIAEIFVRPRARGLLVSTSLSNLFYQAYAPSAAKNRLRHSGDLQTTHFLVTFTKATSSSAVYINGVYSDVRVGTTPTIDGYAFINLNGIFNKTTSDAEITLIYARVWNRTLVAAEAKALCSGSATNGAAEATPC
jgi:hypothetical protein